MKKKGGIIKLNDVSKAKKIKAETAYKAGSRASKNDENAEAKEITLMVLTNTEQKRVKCQLETFCGKPSAGYDYPCPIPFPVRDKAHKLPPMPAIS